MISLCITFCCNACVGKFNIYIPAFFSFLSTICFRELPPRRENSANYQIRPLLDKAGLTRSTYLDPRPNFLILKACLIALPTLRLPIKEVNEAFPI